MAAVALLAGCAPAPVLPTAPASSTLPVAVPPDPAIPPVGGSISPPVDVPDANAPAEPPPVAERGPIPATPRYVKLPPPPALRSEAALRIQLAQRLIAAHPDTSYTGPAPERLLAIPVLEIDLNADGTVRDITVLRKPSTGSQATALAIAAVRRAAPYGDVSRLPKPWRVVETFLFDDDLRFKPRTLDTD